MLLDVYLGILGFRSDCQDNFAALAGRDASDLKCHKEHLLRGFPHRFGVETRLGQELRVPLERRGDRRELDVRLFSHSKDDGVLLGTTVG